MSTTESKPTYLKRDEIVGKSVVSNNASIVGTVADLVVSVDGKIGLRVAPKSGTIEEELIVGSDELHAIGDVILLKPKPIDRSTVVSSQPTPPPFPSTSSQGKTCGRCGYVNSAHSKFCIKCGNSLQL